jgi:hypothetical protein
MRRLSIVLLLAAGVVAATAGPGWSIGPDRGGAQASLRLSGEYGLWVRESGGRMQVRWITDREEPGALRVQHADGQQQRFETPAARAHSAEFPRPRGRSVVLEYGGAAGPAHRTTIDLAAPRRPPVSVSGVDSIFVIADTHGEYDRMVALLRNAGVVDDRLRWTAGRAHLVVLGDMFDRGPDAIRILWFVYDLERQAAVERGRVHTLLGNHEIMVMLGDLRYISPKDSAIAALHGVTYSRMFDVRHSVLGRWLASRPAALRVNDVLFAHGGITPELARLSLRALDDSLAAYMREDLFYHWSDASATVRVDSATLARREDFFWGERSVFWFRDYVRSDTTEAMLREVLRRHRSTLHVVGHTPVNSIGDRLGGALIAAHPPTPAHEMLLLVREREGHRRYRIGAAGAPVPF